MFYGARFSPESKSQNKLFNPCVLYDFISINTCSQSQAGFCIKINICFSVTAAAAFPPFGSNTMPLAALSGDLDTAAHHLSEGMQGNGHLPRPCVTSCTYTGAKHLARTRQLYGEGISPSQGNTALLLTEQDWELRAQEVSNR